LRRDKAQNTLIVQKHWIGELGLPIAFLAIAIALPPTGAGKAANTRVQSKKIIMILFFFTGIRKNL
jgi:hypothetical protein